MFSRKSILFGALLFLILIVFLAGFVSRSSPVKQGLTEKEILAGNVICFGNSLTAGTGAPPEQSYPAMLKEKVPFAVINAGVSGETTAQALSRLERDVLSQNPVIVVVELGANDYFGRIPVKTAEENLTKIINKIRENKSLVMLVGVNLNWEFNRMFQRIAEKNGIILIPDILSGIFDNPDLMSDPLHPNARGYQLVAQIIYQGIYRCLEKAGFSQIIPEKF